ncbi:uncharacterized protein [Procambarus clarkii]|uniref:uncharacterized protein n=1 Tax=Procambarus clarkii TaxID=6728 RepID=UPI003741EDD4
MYILLWLIRRQHSRLGRSTTAWRRPSQQEPGQGCTTRTPPASAWTMVHNPDSSSLSLDNGAQPGLLQPQPGQWCTTWTPPASAWTMVHNLDSSSLSLDNGAQPGLLQPQPGQWCTTWTPPASAWTMVHNLDSSSLSLDTPTRARDSASLQDSALGTALQRFGVEAENGCLIGATVRMWEICEWRRRWQELHSERCSSFFCLPDMRPPYKCRKRSRHIAATRRASTVPEGEVTSAVFGRRRPGRVGGRRAALLKASVAAPQFS